MIRKLMKTGRWGWFEKIFCEKEEFFIPVKLTFNHCHTLEVCRINRLLPSGNRMRGDVGMI